MDEQLRQKVEEELSKKIGKAIEIFEVEKFDEKYILWFQLIEEKSFRQELRYSSLEIQERFNKPDSMFLFFLSENNPIGVFLGYQYDSGSKNSYFVDTIAFSNEGKGLGSTFIHIMLDAHQDSGYKSIILTTEEKNERGFPLVSFYEKMGFKVIERDEINGNVTMEYFFPNYSAQ